MNSMLTAERFGRWEKRCASVMWFSTFFRWVVSSGASGGLPWHTVSSRAMETQAGSMPFSAMVARWGRRRAHRGPLFFLGPGTHFTPPSFTSTAPVTSPAPNWCHHAVTRSIPARLPSPCSITGRDQGIPPS